MKKLNEIIILVLICTLFSCKAVRRITNRQKVLSFTKKIYELKKPLEFTIWQSNKGCKKNLPRLVIDTGVLLSNGNKYIFEPKTNGLEFSNEQAEMMAYYLNSHPLSNATYKLLGSFLINTKSKIIFFNTTYLGGTPQESYLMYAVLNDDLLIETGSFHFTSSDLRSHPSYTKNHETGIFINAKNQVTVYHIEKKYLETWAANNRSKPNKLFTKPYMYSVINLNKTNN